jgi:hypothetical protein
MEIMFGNYRSDEAALLGEYMYVDSEPWFKGITEELGDINRRLAVGRRRIYFF